MFDATAPKPEESFEARNSFRLFHLLGAIAGLQLETPGRYWVVLKLNGTELDRMMIDVHLLSLPERQEAP